MGFQPQTVKASERERGAEGVDIFSRRCKLNGDEMYTCTAELTRCRSTGEGFACSCMHVNVVRRFRVSRGEIVRRFLLQGYVEQIIKNCMIDFGGERGKLLGPNMTNILFACTIINGLQKLNTSSF